MAVIKKKKLSLSTVKPLLSYLMQETCKIYEVPITGQNELEWANCRVPDTPSLLAIN